MFWRRCAMLRPFKSASAVPAHPNLNPSPSATGHSNTVRRFASPSRHTWEEAGAEPGVDTVSDAKPHYHHLQAQCDITIVDFSEEKCHQTYLNNSTLKPFLHKQRESWVSCRWINVNRLSWDVIRTIGNRCGLHRLAVEDVMNTGRSRTKVDWYSDQAFIVLTLQKLVDLAAQHGSKTIQNEDSLEGLASRKGISPLLRLLKISRLRHTTQQDSFSESGDVHLEQKNSIGQLSSMKQLDHSIRTLQRSRGLQNTERIQYMEANSPLSERGLAISVEQVSIFIGRDNTVISFFEHSASDIEAPILSRLHTTDSMLRKTSDSNMIVHAILDGIIDLAFPIIGAYEDTMGTLELDVLTDPQLKHSQRLYIIDSELAALRNTIQPVIGVLNALRAHHSSLRSGIGIPGRPTPDTSIAISAMAEVYLGDVDDHCVTILDSLDNMRRTVDNLIDLIFNTMSAYQNESMKQLTAITIFFLPLSFLTGYFGMNFHKFTYIEDNSDSGFWYIAVPLMVITIAVLMRDMFVRVWNRAITKSIIRRSRKARGVSKYKLSDKQG